MNVQAIEEFRKTPSRFVVSISGGGAAFLSDYLAVPGASDSLVEGIVPYSKAATDAFLGKPPESYCSEHTARLLAAAAFARARSLEPERDPNVALGLGATASLVSNRPKKGRRRVYCAAIARFGAVSATFELSRDPRSRAEEERLAADFILATALFAARKIRNRDGEDALREYSAPFEFESDAPRRADDVATVAWARLDPATADFLYGSRDDAPATLRALRFRDAKLDGALLDDGKTPSVEGSLEEALRRRDEIAPPSTNARRLLFPGSFNPPHAGHAEMFRNAQKRVGTPPELELSARNVDKPPLDVLEILRRVRRIADAFPDAAIWVSNAPRFAEKAALAPGATFVVGADTILRLADPKYENGSVARRDAVLDRLAALDVKFLVFNRKVADRVETGDELRRELPPALAKLCEFVDEPIVDASSTELRRAERQKEREEESRDSA